MVCNVNMIGTCKSFWKVFRTSMSILECPKTKRTLKVFFIPVKHVCGLASLVTLYCRAWNEPKKLLYHLIVQCLNSFMFKGFPKILKIEKAQSLYWRPMNLGEYPTFFESFYFVRQNNCQFGLDANIENIATYFNLFSVVKLILVKIWHNSYNEFMLWSWGISDVSLTDVVWRVSLRKS